MADIDVPAVLREWASNLRAETVRVGFSLPAESDANKAAVTLETPTHVASIRVWGNGMIEFIVLDTRQREEVIMWDKEYTSLEQLQELLDSCIESFSRLIGDPPRLR